MLNEKINFRIDTGEKIIGELFLPSIIGEHGTRLVPVVVFAHGLLSSKTHSRKSWALLKPLVDAGFAFFRFDFYGRGESEGDFSRTSLTKCINCVSSAVDYVVQNELISSQRIYLVGDSFGGLASEILASEDRRIYRLILIAPAINFCYEQIEVPEVQLDATFYQDLSKYDPLSVAEDVSCPVLIVHGKADEVVPVNWSKQLGACITNCQLVMLKDAGHRFKEGDSFSQMTNAIVEFIITFRGGQSPLII